MHRLSHIFVAVGVLSIAACSNSSSGGPAVAGIVVPPTPSPTPTNNSYRPAASGDAFAYAGTTTTTFVRPPASGTILPSPNPSNTQTLSYAITQAQTVASDQTYNETSGAFAFTTVENSTLLGGLATTTSTNVEYYSYTPSGATTAIRDLGGTTTDSAGNAFATTIGATNGLVDVIPETAGALTPANDASMSRMETDADGATDMRTTNDDGTYTEALAYIDGTTANATANADGSGTFSFPIGYATNANFAVGVPVTTGSTPAIPITITYPAGFNGTAPYVRMRSVAVWYPQPLVLAKQTLTNAGATAIPAACNTASSLNVGTANALVSTTTTVDPVFGELDTLTTTSYDEPGVGIACVQSQDVLAQYYDFSEQNGQYVETTSVPTQTTTTTQSLGLTSETVIGLTAKSRLPLVAASEARFRVTLDRRRAERHRQILRAIRASSQRQQGVR